MDIDKLMILIVEDELFMRNLVQRMLRDLGAKRVLAAEHGADALAIVKASRTPFDVVLCDLRMPVLDGYDFVRAVRRGADGADPALPIVIMSGLSDAESVETALGIGIDGYLVKPVSLVSLQARIKAALDPARLGKVAAARRAAATALSAAALAANVDGTAGAA